MSKIISLTKIILFISILSIYKCEEQPKQEKSKIKWTTETLLKYTLKHHGKDKYFICDPLNYITEEEKEVIYYRLETIYNKLNITSVFFVLDKISMEGLNLTSIDNDDEFEDEEIVVNNKNNTASFLNISLNETLNRSEELKKREFQVYIGEIRKKLFNRKIFLDKESKCLIGIYTVEDLGKYLYVGKDYRDMVNEKEIETLLEGKEYYMKKGNLYLAVDNLFSNFAYRYAPGKIDQFNKFMGVMGEVLGIGAIIFSYFLMNRNNQGEAQPPANQNNNNKKEKKEEENKDKSDKKENEENKNEEKPKKD